MDCDWQQRIRTEATGIQGELLVLGDQDPCLRQVGDPLASRPGKRMVMGPLYGSTN